jgi:hypothetical protein
MKIHSPTKEPKDRKKLTSGDLCVMEAAVVNGEVDK